MGIKFIGEMSKEELIEELIEAYRTSCAKREMTDLKHEVIQLRMAIVRDNMLKEAGLKATHGPLGMMSIEEDDSP